MQLKLYHLAIAGMIAFAGCRTAELMSCRIDLPPGVTSCGAITINQTMYAEDVGQAQGKTIEAAASAAASIAATIRDITASQSGDATGGSDTGDGGTDATTADLPDMQLDAKNDQIAAPNGDD